MGKGDDAKSSFSSAMFILKAAVGATDFADDTDKEGIVVQGVFTRRVTAKELTTMTKPVPIRVIRAIRGF